MNIPILLNTGLDVNHITHEIEPIYDLSGTGKIVDYACVIKLQVGHSGTIYINLSELGQLDELVNQIQEARNSWTEKFAEMEVKRMRKE